MKYEDMRHTIKSGDLLAFSHYSWKSWYDLKIQAVRLFTQSEYTHVGLAWVVSDRVFVIEAVVPKVRIYPLSKLGDFYHIPMNVDWNHDVESYALSVVGEPYSQMQAIKSYFDTPKKDEKWQCCEFVREVYKLAGVNLPGKFTPTATVLAAQELGYPTFFVTNK